MRREGVLRLKSKTSKQSMNILFYERMKFENTATQLVHIHELSSNLSKLGHNIIFAEVVRSENKKGICFKQESSWARFKNLDIRKFLLSLIIVFRQKKRPDVIYMRHGGLFNLGYFLAKLLRVPFIKEVNGIIIGEIQIWRHRNKVILWIIDKIERFNLPKVDKIVAVTTKLKRVLQDDYKIPGDKIVVIQNGANTELFKPMDIVKARKELALNQNNTYICFVGSLSPHQGLEYLIKSAPLVLKKCPATHFMIVGYGKMEQELKDLAEKTGVSDKFIFTGAVPYEKVPLYINACDVCVVPKKPWRYGYSPLKLHENMACGKPVVATRTDGFEDLEKYNAGILVNIENLEEFANAFVKLLKNENLRKQMGKNGREYVVKYHSWESVAKRVAEVCEEAIREHKDKRR